MGPHSLARGASLNQGLVTGTPTSLVLRERVTAHMAGQHNDGIALQGRGVR